VRRAFTLAAIGLLAPLELLVSQQEGPGPGSASLRARAVVVSTQAARESQSLVTSLIRTPATQRPAVRRQGLAWVRIERSGAGRRVTVNHLAN
jgi:hypothetical protein